MSGAACSEPWLLGWGSCSGLQCPWSVGERIPKRKLGKQELCREQLRKPSPGEEVF